MSLYGTLALSSFSFILFFSKVVSLNTAHGEVYSIQKLVGKQFAPKQRKVRIATSEPGYYVGRFMLLLPY